MICLGLKLFLCFLFPSLAALDFAKLYATMGSSLAINCMFSTPSLSPRYIAADSAKIILPGPEIAFGDNGIVPVGDQIRYALERNPG